MDSLRNDFSLSEKIEDWALCKFFTLLDKSAAVYGLFKPAYDTAFCKI